jgi:hypothetical protein
MNGVSRAAKKPAARAMPMEENSVKKTAAPISLAGSQLGEVRHVCAFFNSDDEEYRVLLPFIKDGFECGDKAVR